MAKTLLIFISLFVLLGFIDQTQATISSLTRNCNRRTRPNEVYSDCGNNECQNTCSRPTASTGCVGACIPGCICVPGFLRNSKNICVLPNACESPVSHLLNNFQNIGCRANEVYSSCGNDGCRPSCTTPVVTNCTPRCSIPSCICANGYVRNNQGQCVLPSSCPTTPVCSRLNEVFSNCGNDGCQRSCSRINVGTCIPVCSTPGCICDIGFVRNTAGNCVLPSTCPTLPCTRINEVFSNCGDDGCQPTCNTQVLPGCTSVCSNPRCVCASGYVRNSAGDCVTPANCPATNVCNNANEVFSPCGNTACQTTCAVMNPPTGCACNPGCICGTGTFRNYLGLCVTSSSCNVCPTNEVFRTCGAGVCEGTCATPGLASSPSCSTAGACASRCFCSNGFVRNQAGNCVPPISC